MRGSAPPLTGIPVTGQIMSRQVLIVSAEPRGSEQSVESAAKARAKGGRLVTKVFPLDVARVVTCHVRTRQVATTSTGLSGLDTLCAAIDYWHVDRSIEPSICNDV